MGEKVKSSNSIRYFHYWVPQTIKSGRNSKVFPWQKTSGNLLKSRIVNLETSFRRWNYLKRGWTCSRVYLYTILILVLVVTKHSIIHILLKHHLPFIIACFQHGLPNQNLVPVLSRRHRRRSHLQAEGRSKNSKTTKMKEVSH